MCVCLCCVVCVCVMEGRRKEEGDNLKYSFLPCTLFETESLAFPARPGSVLGVSCFHFQSCFTGMMNACTIMSVFTGSLNIWTQDLMIVF